MQQSNTYIIIFTAILTIIIGGLLSLANQVLKEKQQKSIEIDTKKQILGAVLDVSDISNNQILEEYNASITSIVVDFSGEPIEKNEKGGDIVAEEVNIAKNFKKKKEDRQYPVFIYHQKGDPNQVEAYIFPHYGTGLWGPIWGFVALKTDLNTIKGAVFAHEGETPGLGARITEKEVQDRFVGKKIFDDQGNLVSVSMLKGENNPEKAKNDHLIDGMSGATITGKGLNNMMLNYFEYYQSYIDKVKTETKKVAVL